MTLVVILGRLFNFPGFNFPLENEKNKFNILKSVLNGAPDFLW